MTTRTHPLASIIIVNTNELHHLIKCLPTVTRQSYSNYEVIVVDNASSDGSVAYIEQRFPTVRVVKSTVNLGYAGANNLGFKSAHGAYVAVLNPDTRVDSYWLAELVRALEADLKAGLATSKILLLSDSGRINTCGNDMHCSGLTLCRGMGLDRNDLADPAQVSAVSGAAFVIRRELFELLGGFDEAFFSYMEDTDLSWRARLVGYRCIYVPTSVVHHDYALRFGPHKTFYQERNRYLMLLKVLRWRTLIVLLPILLLAEVVTWGFVLLRDRNRLANKVRAYAWIAQHWDYVMAQRRQTQALRRVRDRDLIAIFTHRLVYEQTGDSMAARLAHALFDPLFLVFQKFTLAVTRW